VAPVLGPDDVRAFARRYLDRLMDVLRERSHDPAGFAAQRLAQVEAVNARYSWQARAREWQDAITGWQRAKPQS
jgi:hypothetical protein